MSSEAREGEGGKGNNVAKDRFKAHISVYLFLEKENKILLYLRQNSGFADGYYSLVSGHLEKDETITNAMVREAKEEAGITIDPQEMQVLHVMHSLYDKEYVNIFFHCKKWHGEITNLEPTKCGELKFFEKDNLPKNTLSYVKTALKKSNSGIIYSETGWE